MYGIGGNAHIAGDDGIYGGYTVGKGSTAYTIVVKHGIAVIGGKRLHRETDTDATDITVAPATLTPGAHIVYLNHPDALDAAGDALADFTFDTPEADTSRTAIQGSVPTREGRSLALAEVTLAANTGTVTFAGDWAAADTATITVDGTAVVATMIAGDDTAAEAAERAKLALEGNTTVAGKVTISRDGAVLTITAKTVSATSAYTLVAAEVTAGTGTATRSAAALAGGGIAASGAVDNSIKLMPKYGASRASRRAYE